mgnify:FL=1
MVTLPTPNVKKETLRAGVNAAVATGSIVSTDELVSYGLLDGDGYTHGRVQHRAKEFAFYDYRMGASHHTNHVESFWKLFKASVRSTRIQISGKYMQRHLSEFTFGPNHRQMENAIFDLLIGAV